MSEETVPENETAPAAESPEPVPVPEPAKKKRKRKKSTTPRGQRKPSFKDWIRVIKSQGNTMENTQIHLVYNKATSTCTLVTNAKASEDSSEMEGEKRQIFKVTSFEEIDQPEETPAEEPEKAPA